MNELPKNLSVFKLNEWLQGDLEKPILVDVREDKELQIAPFPFAYTHLPLSRSSDWINDLSEYLPVQKPIVVFCHAGVRSWNFGSWLINESWDGEIWNLDGGIDAWSVNIDPSVPRY